MQLFDTGIKTIHMEDKIDITQFLISEDKIEKELPNILGDVIILNNDFHIVNVGINVLNALNFSPEDLKYKPISEIFSDFGQVNNIHYLLNKYGYFSEREIKANTRLGHSLAISVSGYYLGLITDMNGYVILNVKNLDDVKALFENLKYKTFELDEFLYRVSHDLRGPVATIKGLVNVAQLKNTNITDLNFYIDQIGAYAEKLDNTLKNIIQTTDKDIFSNEFILKANIDNIQEILKRIVVEKSKNLVIDFTFDTDQFNPSNTFPQTLILQFLKNMVQFIFELTPLEEPLSIEIVIKGKGEKTEVLIKQSGFKINNFLINKGNQNTLFISDALKDAALSHFYTAKKIVDKIGVPMETTVHSTISHTHSILF
ncbi:MAG: hypothetical protein SFY32_15385 [Bacteroidota bacterium]|nr:hypothetical protein [Bacteroidota bacterium]